jgi:hypothetical protein
VSFILLELGLSFPSMIVAHIVEIGALVGWVGRDVGDGLVQPTTAQLEERRKGLVFEDAVPVRFLRQRASTSVLI